MYNDTVFIKVFLIDRSVNKRPFGFSLSLNASPRFFWVSDPTR
ncbi:hypothetical protein PDR5_14700 [Pseudomonas sp. DR 5-09]|nr:hypothetical protein PDR5_14700 [Pseudomonas sp. DR 5-09]